MEKIKAGILGATGMVGQKYIHLLQDHPWFTVTYVAASERSAGKSFREAVHGRWLDGDGVPSNIGGLVVGSVGDIDTARERCEFVFSALESGIARTYEENYAGGGIPVISSASAHRWTPDVPVLIPEINHAHIDIIPIQRKNRKWDRGFIVVKPNCSLQSYLTPLYALHREFTLRRAIITTLQAVSGAGYPGLSSYDMVENTLPYIKGEEEKSEQEPLKILGIINGKEIVSHAGFKISAHCNRVMTRDGHTACVSVEFEEKPSKKAIIDAWTGFRSLPQELGLPLAPERPIIYREEPDRPQVRWDVNADKGMAVTAGRLRECNVLHFRFVGLSHNTIRGAAGGGILNAELLKARGYL